MDPYQMSMFQWTTTLDGRGGLLTSNMKILEMQMMLNTTLIEPVSWVESCQWSLQEEIEKILARWEQKKEVVASPHVTEVMGEEVATEVAEGEDQETVIDPEVEAQDVVMTAAPGHVHHPGTAGGPAHPHQITEDLVPIPSPLAAATDHLKLMEIATVPHLKYNPLVIHINGRHRTLPHPLHILYVGMFKYWCEWEIENT